jgi:hypothetical protein
MAFCSTAAVLACARGIASPALPATESSGGSSSGGGIGSSPPPAAQLSSGNLTPAAAADTPPSGSLLRGGARAPATKVIASIGPASRDAATLDALLEAGMSCARLDASNARPLFWHVETYELLQARRARRGAARRGGGGVRWQCRKPALAFGFFSPSAAAARARSAAAPRRRCGARPARRATLASARAKLP